MCISKSFYLFMFAGLLAIGNVAHAAVYDFGNLSKTLRGDFALNSFAQLAVTENGLHNNHFEIQFGQENLNSFSGYKWGKGKWSGFSLNIVSNTRNISGFVQGNEGGYVAMYTTMTASVPEPETFAMILAGLGLIGFTARRRKWDE